MPDVVDAIARSLSPSSAAVPKSWSGLSSHLVARIIQCDFDGKPVADSSSVVGPITDSDINLTLNWQSPFENSGPESKAPALMAMIQSGQLGPVVNALEESGLGKVVPENIRDALKTNIKDLEGKTGITKLNSRQIFSGMPPMKFSFTLHLRALENATSEVLQPFTRLMQWALPQELAKDSTLTGVIKSGSGKDIVNALFPSKAPITVALYYANESYAPMVIEGVSRPLEVERDGNGVPIYIAVQLTLATLTALDRKDVTNIFS